MLLKLFSKVIPSRYVTQLKNFITLASIYGQYGSIKRWDCVDAKGVEIPWYTYPAIEYLNNIDFTQKNVLEYGSGNSSAFWAERSLGVLSVEHDQNWYKKVKKSLRSNQSLQLRKNDSSYENLGDVICNKKFDVIIIDGIRRVECSKMIGSYLNRQSDEGFMIVLDNSDWYKGTAEYLRSNFDLIEVDFHGFGPINGYTWTTSVFLSRNFRFNAVGGVQPAFSLAAIIDSAE